MEDEETNFSLPSLIDSESLLQEIGFMEHVDDNEEAEAFTTQPPTRGKGKGKGKGDATGLRGTFPGHPRLFHLTFTDIHNNIYTHMGAFPDGTRTRTDLAVVAERVLILPSTTLPSAPRRHTHTSMARRRFLPLKKSSPFAESGAQVDAKEKLSAGLERALESFRPRAKFLTEVHNESLRFEPPIFRFVTSTPVQEIRSWGIVFQGDRKDDPAVFDFIVRVNEKCASLDLSQDALLGLAKLLLKDEALIWLKEQFLPIGYSETARDNLLKYRQTGGQSIWMFLARFEQLEGYLPRPLPFPEKMATIQRNILSYYQDCL
ncbi:hypothetical protein MTP99_007906 [Tenebrio molitor]|nr:hypothetical protein MTP99_007906 [Tenebrio molitor]